MTVLFKSYNLIGDGLVATPAIEGYYRQLTNEKKDPQITVATHAHCAKLYQRMGFPVEILSVGEDEIDERKYDFVFRFHVGKAWNLGTLQNIPCSLAYAVMLGVQVKTTLPIYQTPPENLANAKAGLVLFQPYSRSCSSHSGEPPNKRLKDSSWVELYNLIKRDFPEQEVVVVGSKDDQDITGIPPESHKRDLDFDDLAAMQAKAKLVVTLDNGISHLASSQQARMLEFYPACLPDRWMSKLENPLYRMIHAVPWDLPADWIYDHVKRGILASDAPETEMIQAEVKDEQANSQ